MNGTPDSRGLMGLDVSRAVLPYLNFAGTFICDNLGALNLGSSTDSWAAGGHLLQTVNNRRNSRVLGAIRTYPNAGGGGIGVPTGWPETEYVSKLTGSSAAQHGSDLTSTSLLRLGSASTSGIGLGHDSRGEIKCPGSRRDLRRATDPNKISGRPRIAWKRTIKNDPPCLTLCPRRAHH